MEFGFSLHEDLLVDHDRTLTTCEELLTRVPSLATCMSCGSCTGTCVAVLNSGSGFRKFLVLLRNGSRMELVRALKHCQLCGKCWLACPRGVNTRKAILEMKTLLKEQSVSPVRAGPKAGPVRRNDPSRKDDLRPQNDPFHRSKPVPRSR
jgi:heterodisulfide reductase subunit C